MLCVRHKSGIYSTGEEVASRDEGELNQDIDIDITDTGKYSFYDIFIVI